MTDFSKVREAWNTIIKACKEMQNEGNKPFGYNPSSENYYAFCENCPLEVPCKVETKNGFCDCCEFDDYYK